MRTLTEQLEIYADRFDRSYEMSNRPFGIEIEGYVEREFEDSLDFGDYLEKKWRSKGDDSIEPMVINFECDIEDCEYYGESYNGNFYNCINNECEKIENHSLSVEFNSPPLKGKDGIEEIRQFYNLIDKYNYSFNDSCGLHIHHDVSDYEKEDFLSLVNLLLIVKENLRFIIDDNRKDNRYCNFNYDNRNKANDLYYFNEYFKCFGKERFRKEYLEETYDSTANLKFERFLNRIYNIDRYMFCNLSSYWSHGTIEFRCLEATDNFEKIMGWIKLTQIIIESAKNYNYYFNSSTIKKVNENLAYNPEKVLTLSSMFRLFKLSGIKNMGNIRDYCNKYMIY